jgi:hypothetical protein
VQITYGRIVDFKELFGDMQQAIAVYSSDELDVDEGGGDNNVHLKDWLEEGKRKVDEAREALHYLGEPVALPQEVEQFLHYFCGDAANPNALNETEALSVAFTRPLRSLCVRSPPSRRTSLKLDIPKPTRLNFRKRSSSMVKSVLPEVGAAVWRRVGRLFPPAHEDQVGRLQPPGADHPLEYGTREEAKDLLEYVVVHEMVHLIVPTHNQEFVALMNKHYPAWREARAELNELPLSAEVWNE